MCGSARADRSRNLTRLIFGGTMIRPDRQRLAIGRLPALLDDMCQFVRQQLLSDSGGRLVLIGLERDMRADGVGPRANVLNPLASLRVSVNADLAEVVAQARLQLGTRGGIQRLARRVQHLVDGRRHDRRRAGGGGALESCVAAGACPSES